MTASKHSADSLKEMLTEVNKALKAIAEVISEMPTHGDLHDDHVELAKTAKNLAEETHARLEAVTANRKPRA